MSFHNHIVLLVEVVVVAAVEVQKHPSMSCRKSGLGCKVLIDHTKGYSSLSPETEEPRSPEVLLPLSPWTGRKQEMDLEARLTQSDVVLYLSVEVHTSRDALDCVHDEQTVVGLSRRVDGRHRDGQWG